VMRRSILQLAAYLGIKVVERPLPIEEVISSIKSGQLKEAFASGTAAVVSPVGQIYYRKKEYVINGGKTGPLAEMLFNEILQLQYGFREDPFNWRVEVDA